MSEMDEITQDYWFLVKQCGVDGDQLGTHWAVYQLMVRNPEFDEETAAEIVQEYGWH